MADIFTKRDVEKLLERKNIWFFGDSNMRGMYKDLIWLLEKNTLIELNSLKGKLEASFMNDVLIRGGSLHRGRDFQEIRLYKNFKIKSNMEYTFITQCFNKTLQERLSYACSRKEMPDIVVINSCLWDITRWGPESVKKYKSNISDLIKFLKANLPSKTRVIWITTPPVSKEPRGGFFIKQIDFLKHTLRFEVMEANAFVSREFTLCGFDVLDIHYHLLLQIHRRRPDGIHWSPEAMRHITNLFLTHVCVSWNAPLPRNFKSPLLDRLQPKKGEISSDAKPVQQLSSVKIGPEIPKLLKSLQVKMAGLPRPIQPLTSARIGTEIPELLKSLQAKKPKNRRKGGKKRDWNGNFIVQKTQNFVNDVCDYDYKRKRFKVGGRRNC